MFRFFVQRHGVTLETLSEFNQPRNLKKIDPNIIQVFTIPKKHPKKDILKYWNQYVGFLEQDLRKIQFDEPSENADHKEDAENIEREIKGLISIINNEYHIEEVLEVAKEFHFAIQQYLLLSKEYLDKTQQEEIQLDVQEYPSGVMLRVKLLGDQKVEIVKMWLNEYMELLKQNTGNLKINISENTPPREADLMIPKLKNQITHLQNTVRIVEMEKNMLTQDKEFFQRLAMAFADNKPSSITIKQNTSQQTGRGNKSVQDIDDSELDI